MTIIFIVSRHYLKKKKEIKKNRPKKTSISLQFICSLEFGIPIFIMQAMEEWTAIYTELLFRDLNILCNWVFFF